MARLYADEQYPHPVVEYLRVLGHDVLTVQEAGKANQKVPDSEVLAFAAIACRAVLTQNRKDFIQLHRAQTSHGGIIACTNRSQLGSAGEPSGCRDRCRRLPTRQTDSSRASSSTSKLGFTHFTVPGL